MATTIAQNLQILIDTKKYIKDAIEEKGVDMSGVPFTEYANKIADISGGGGEVDEYFYYAKAYYTITNNATLFENAWQDMKDIGTALFDIPLSLAAVNQELMEDVYVDLYVGTNGQLQALYDACVNETIPQPINVNNVETPYNGDVSGMFGFPTPLYMFGDSDPFFIGDLTPLEMGLGLVLAKIADDLIPNNNIVIQQGFKFENENGIIIPESVTSINKRTFDDWETNNQPLVIPNSVTSIGEYAFQGWRANKQPLVIPNSVTSIDIRAFQNWTSNNQPLVIGNSVTSIGRWAFENWMANNQPLVIPNSVTSIDVGVFDGWQSNNQPLVIPDSVTSIDGGFERWYSNNQPLVIPNSVTSIGGSAFANWRANNQPLVIPNSLTRISGAAFRGWTSNNQSLVIPNSVTRIDDWAFGEWSANNQPLVIPNSVTSIDYYAFDSWASNKQPLVIGNSVTSIGYGAFRGWTSNNQPLVILNSVTSIGDYAFKNWSLVPYIIMEREVPPTILSESFSNQNDAPIYVPHDSVDDYKTATNWTVYASRIKSINDKP